MLNIENIDELIDVISFSGRDDTAAPKVFTVANELMRLAITDISDVINRDGIVTLDIAGLRSLFLDAGMTMMVSAIASGADRARGATETAIASLLLEGADMIRVRRFLVSITSTSSLKLKELVVAIKCIKSTAAQNSLIVICTAVNESMGDDLRVTVFAIGLSASLRRNPARPIHPNHVNNNFGKTLN